MLYEVITSFQEALELFSAVLPESAKQTERLGRISGNKEKIEFLRAKVISQAINEILACFLDHESDILAGRFDEPLMSRIPRNNFV